MGRNLIIFSVILLLSLSFAGVFYLANKLINDNNESQTTVSPNINIKASTPSPEHTVSPQTSLPVANQEQTMIIKIFLTNPQTAEQDCKGLTAVSRTIPKTQSVARAAVEQLLQGPSQQEKAQGLNSSIPEGTKLQSIDIENGTARIDFNDTLDHAGGSCNIAAIRSQISQTLKQFSSVNQVIISVNGESETILQP